MRLTIDEYSKKFKISKEMIHAKLRDRDLNYITENGETYIIVQEEEANKKQLDLTAPQKKRTTAEVLPHKQKTTVAMVLSLYQKENQQLKEKILKLEAKIDELIHDKEQMLREEMSKIEHVYSQKDEQLKTILELISKQLATTQQAQQQNSLQPESKESEKEDEIVELKAYLKTLDLEPHQRKIIKKRFLAVYDKDIRIIKKHGKLYLNFSKYDYSDLLEY